MKRIRQNIESRGYGAIKIAVVAFTSLISIACGANEGILKSGRETPVVSNSTPVVTSLEKDVEEMRTADFKFIYVLRRKDGGKIDAADRVVIKEQTIDANRRVSSDSGKAIVVGSNFAIPPDKLLAIYDRFAVENYSTAGTNEK